MRGWSDVRTAERYDAFASGYDLYRMTSRELVALASLDTADLVVDLACGTGVTTQVILDRVPASCRVVGLDVSEAMLSIARRAVRDSRVSWVCAPAVDLAHLVTQADAVVCNAAIWQLEIGEVIAATAKSLRLGGQFVFNIGSQFLVLPQAEGILPDATATMADVVQAVAARAHGFSLRSAARCGELRLALADVSDLLMHSDLRLTSTAMLQQTLSPQEQLAWLQVPVFLQEVLPGMPDELRQDVLDKAVQYVDKACDAKRRWMAFAAVLTSGAEGREHAASADF